MNPLIKSILRKLEGTREQFWNINPETGAFLHLLVLNRKYKTVLEIGTSNGYSGIWIASALKVNKGHLYTIESHKKLRYHLAVENFKNSGLARNITPILGHAPEAIPKFPKKFDLIFLDATKYEHLSYLKALRNRLKKGGIIITDNYNSHKKDLTPYLATIKKDPAFKTNILGLGTGLIISLKTSSPRP